jgi:hypothetical protein
MDLADVYYDLGKYEEALALYLDMASLDQVRVHSLANLASVARFDTCPLRFVDMHDTTVAPSGKLPSQSREL